MQDGLLHFIIQFKIQGISEGQREAIKAIEVSAMRNAIKSLGLQIQIIFICIEKNTTMKFYNIQNENSMNNCPPGTLIDDPQICKEDEFFLICQKTFQGIPNPTHYFILVNDLIKSMNQEQANKIKKSIEILCFKLCHLYFNWVGGKNKNSQYYYNSFKQQKFLRLVCMHIGFQIQLAIDGLIQISFHMQIYRLKNHYILFEYPMYSALIPVSYTHLTLPTKRIVQILFVVVS
eukprot:TRINITY_DN40983_c0_g1_i2.p1 TRINITY_DN40983_c0_g1~~TRINITY_DN40983_c0_g1_i2.p1  ORF type:complete len:233 (+),score=32.31 TRINITY_DN40983_c0_g1_i2:1-699(+)